MRTAFLLASLVLAAPLLAGCLGESEDALEPSTVVGTQPDLPWGIEVPDVIEGVEHVAQALTEEGQPFVAAGIWAHGHHVYVPGYTGGGLRIIDVSDPASPVVVGHVPLEGQSYPRDADMVVFEDRLILAVATNYAGLQLIDVTDPANATVVSKFAHARVHNLGVVPGEPVVYLSTGRKHIPNAIVDVSVPEAPAYVGSYSEFPCHDVSFFISEDGSKKRAYCAGNQRTILFDIADPRNPVEVARVSNPCMDHELPGPDPPQEPELEDGFCGGFHHSAFVNNDASVLIIGDEYEGASRPGCLGHAETPLGSASSPIGALWFYDISNERSAQLLGWFSPEPPVTDYLEAADLTNPPAPGPNAHGQLLSRMSCTSHFGQVVPGHEKVVVGWYTAGVLLIDFEDPANPVLVDQFNPGGMDTWDARIHGGHVFTGDQKRGLDVLRFV